VSFVWGTAVAIASGIKQTTIPSLAL
jgi:hypothetical protein